MTLRANTVLPLRSPFCAKLQPKPAESFLLYALIAARSASYALTFALVQEYGVPVRSGN